MEPCFLLNVTSTVDVDLSMDLERFKELEGVTYELPSFILGRCSISLNLVWMICLEANFLNSLYSVTLSHGYQWAPCLAAVL